MLAIWARSTRERTFTRRPWFQAFVVGWYLMPPGVNPESGSVETGMSGGRDRPGCSYGTGVLSYFVDGYLETVVDANTVSQPTPVALAVTTSDDLYVLPAAFTVVPTAGPAISSVSGSNDAQGNATVTLNGENLGLDTRVLFDGAAATSIQKNDDGSFTVAAPPAIGNHVAVARSAVDRRADLQCSMGASPLPTFTYCVARTVPSLSITPATVTAGTDTMIEVDGINTNFADGQTVIGFGSSDVTVRRTWIINPGKALLNISINSGATRRVRSR